MISLESSVIPIQNIPKRSHTMSKSMPPGNACGLSVMLLKNVKFVEIIELGPKILSRERSTIDICPLVFARVVQKVSQFIEVLSVNQFIESLCQVLFCVSHLQVICGVSSSEHRLGTLQPRWRRSKTSTKRFSHLLQ